MKNMFGACPSFVKEVIAYDLKKKIAAPVMSAAMSGLLYKLEVVIFPLDKITISLLIKHLDITENEYRFNTQFLFRFTQMMTAITINGIMLIIPIYAGPRIALSAYSGLER